MIMIVSDTHCYYEMINYQIEYAEAELGLQISCVIHLGDFGIYKNHLRDYFRKRNQRFIRPVYFIDGNHEDFRHLDKLVTEYSDCFTYLPRATVHEIMGYRFLALGGSAYMDSILTERGSVITDRQIEQCLSFSGDSVDIVLTHDCPEGIGVPGTPGMEHYGETGFPRSGELAHHFKPKLWLFGHHHKWFLSEDTHTFYYGVSGIWKGFGLLDENYNFEMITNDVKWAELTFVEKILVKLRILVPDSASFR